MTSTGQVYRDAGLRGAFKDAGGSLDLFVFDEGHADIDAGGLEEGVGHAATQEEHVDFRQQVVDRGDLRADFCAADDCGERASAGSRRARDR